MDRHTLFRRKLFSNKESEDEESSVCDDSEEDPDFIPGTPEKHSKLGFRIRGGDEGRPRGGGQWYRGCGMARVLTALRLPRVRSACCVSLRTGTILIAALHLILVVFSFLVAEIHDTKLKTNTGSGNSLANFRTDVLGYPVTLIFSTVFLFIGVRKNDTTWVTPFLMMKGAEIIQETFSACEGIFLRLFKFKTLYIFFQLSFLVLQCCVFKIVYSYHEELQEGKRNQTQETDEDR